MLQAQEIRTGIWEHFITDLHGWAVGSRETRARMVVEEWLSLYEGENVGPLDRQPIERWLEAFTAVGYFEATVTLTERAPLQLEEAVAVTIDNGAPESVPDLWRISTRANARRFSWLDNTASVMQVVRTPDLHIWRARNPYKVFGKITTRYNLLPDTRFWEAHGYPPEAWELKHDFTEYIAAPGADVREMIPVDLDPDDPQIYLKEGRAV